MGCKTIRASDPDDFYDQIPGELNALARSTRGLLLDSLAGCEEALKWGVPNYITSEKLCYLSYEDGGYLRLGFTRATELADPDGLLEGSGKGMRHIKLRTPADLPEAQVRAWCREAAELAAR